MKVFSKGSKTNKSTPSLHHPQLQTTQCILSKPKSNTKLTTFKQILSQNQNNPNNKSCIQSQQYVTDAHSRPKTTRDKLTPNSARDYPHTPHPNLPTVKMITSVINDYKGIRTEGDCRSSSDSIEKIESVLYYGKALPSKPSPATRQPQNKNQWNISVIAQPNNSKRAEKSLQQAGKENQLTTSNLQHGESKKMNHYKNTRLNYYNAKMTLKKLSLECFKMGRKIGRGRFGCVYVAEEKVTGMVFALKLIDLQQVKEEQMENQIIEELKLQLFMSNPNVLKMYGCFRDGEQLCMILEYAEGKCLFNKLNDEMEEKTVAYYTRQMIDALKYCHSENILHRDLKPENILLCFGVAKLADFGWAAYAPKYKRITFCGTLDYVPPEILKGEHYDEKVDIWSLGVLIYEMATGKAPFETQSIDPSHTEAKTMTRIIDGDLLIPLHISPALRKLIGSILTTQPAKRPSLEQIESNPWMHSNREESFEVDRRIRQFWLR